MIHKYNEKVFTIHVPSICPTRCGVVWCGVACARARAVWPQKDFHAVLHQLLVGGIRAAHS
jgi:hypothetical protein